MLCACQTEVGCAPGYFQGGRLCHACAQGYGRSGANACARCPDETWNIILVILGAVALVVVMTALIYFTRKSAASEKDLLMQMFKIFLRCVLRAGPNVPAPFTATRLHDLWQLLPICVVRAELASSVADHLAANL